MGGQVPLLDLLDLLVWARSVSWVVMFVTVMTVMVLAVGRTHRHARRVSPHDWAGGCGGSSSPTHDAAERPTHIHFMATPIPIPPAGGPADPARPLLSYIPVFEVVVGTAVLLAAAGVIFAIVPALRRRRALVTAWVLSASAFSLAFIVWVLWALHQFT
jgi:hypothetical protein